MIAVVLGVNDAGLQVADCCECWHLRSILKSRQPGLDQPKPVQLAYGRTGLARELASYVDVSSQRSVCIKNLHALASGSVVAGLHSESIG